MAPSRLKRTVFIAIAVLIIVSPFFAAEAVVRRMGLGDPNLGLGKLRLKDLLRIEGEKT